jgi:glycosyltransferase involved in cell wall biosynthesis
LKIGIYSVLNLGNGAGAERWIEEVATRLRNKEYEVTVVTTRHGDNRDPTIKSKLIKCGVTVSEFDSYSHIVLPRVQYSKDIANILRQNDIVYFNNAFALNEVYLYLLKFLFKLRIISGNHGSFPETGNMIRRLYHSVVGRSINGRFDGHHVLNRERKNQLLHWGFRNIFQIPNGVNTIKYHPSKKDSLFSIMFAGTMNIQKGIDRFAKVVEGINKDKHSRNNIKFRIFGSGGFSYIAHALKDNFENVEYGGYVSLNELLEAYQKSHVFVITSRFEEFSIAALEALACGTPVIASNIPGPREMITDGISGFLVNSDVADEIIKKVLYLKHLWYDKPDLYQKFSSQARTMALKFDWNQVVVELIDMFNSISK